MKKIIIIILMTLVAVKQVVASQQDITQISGVQSSIGALKAQVNPRLDATQANFTELYGSVSTLTSALNGKASISCFANSAAAAACGIDLDWLATGVGFDQAGNYMVTGSWDFSGASVTGITGTVPTGTENQIPIYNSSGTLTATTSLTPVAGQNITLTTDTTAGTVTIASTGGATYPGAGIPQSTGSTWGSSITPGTGVATALAAAVDGTGGLASKSYVDANSGGAFETLSAVPYSDVACTSNGVYNHTAYFCVDGYYTERIATTEHNILTPATYSLTIDGTGWDGTDSVSVSGSTYTADGTETGLSGSVPVTVAPGAGRVGAVSGSCMSGSTSPYSALMSSDCTLYVNFAQSTSSVVDLFNRANGILGANWTSMTVGTFGATTHVIHTNKILTSISDAATSYYTGMVFNDNQYAKVTLGTATAGSFGVGVRLNSSGNGYVGRCYNETSCVISKLTAGSPSTLGAAFTVQSWTGQVIELRASGSTLELLLNGASLGTRTDSTYTSGAPGISTGSMTSLTYGLDNFEGGNL